MHALRVRTHAAIKVPQITTMEGEDKWNTKCFLK